MSNSDELPKIAAENIQIQGSYLTAIYNHAYRAIHPDTKEPLFNVKDAKKTQSNETKTDVSNSSDDKDGVETSDNKESLENRSDSGQVSNRQAVNITLPEYGADINKNTSEFLDNNLATTESKVILPNVVPPVKKKLKLKKDKTKNIKNKKKKEIKKIQNLQIMLEEKRITIQAKIKAYEEKMKRLKIQPNNAELKKILRENWLEIKQEGNLIIY